MKTLTKRCICTARSIFSSCPAHMLALCLGGIVVLAMAGMSVGERNVADDRNVANDRQVSSDRQVNIDQNVADMATISNVGPSATSSDAELERAEFEASISMSDISPELEQALEARANAPRGGGGAALQACGDPDAGDCCEAQVDSPYCDDEECCEMICAADPFCCDVNWDGLCAGAANDECAVCQPDPACGVPGTGNCCEANDSPFCENEECCEQVCDNDPFCCENEWDGICADVANEECDICIPFECPDDHEEVDEPCGEDVHGGCNMDVPNFWPIECGGNYCATAWAEGGTRDTDWYEIVTSTHTEFTWTVTAEFPVVIGYVDTGGSGDCADAAALDPFATGDPGQEISITVELGPGTHWFFVADQAFDGNPCGSGANGYVANLECDKAEPPVCPDLTGDGIVGPADLLYLLDCWGPATGDCENADLNDDGVVDWFDLLELLENWDCFTGDPPCGHPDAGDCCNANPTPNCSDLECCEMICADDPFCCENEWDNLCADAANEQCPVCDVISCGHPDAGDCCTANTDSPFCEDEECCEMICAQDAFCCDINWDGLCAGAAEEQCEVCFGCGSSGAGSCCEANDTPYCNNEACCEQICAEDPFCCDTEWDGICADMANDEETGCDVCIPAECPDGFEEVDEACGEDVHGGCNMDVPNFWPIECGGGYCATAWAEGGTRDTDWYEIVTEDTIEFTWTVTAEFPVVIGYVDTGGSGDCADAAALDPFATADPFEEVSITVTLGPGTHWFFVADQAFDGNPCGSGSNFYTAELDCDITEPACGVPGTGSCCEANDSPYCEDEECCEQICAVDPFCCDSEWDTLCADAANDKETGCGVCFEPACGVSGTGDCCEAQVDSPYCEDEECCEQICAADPFCCDVNWDGLCAGAAQDQCAVCQ